MAQGKKIQATAFMTNKCPLNCSYCLTGKMKEEDIRKIDVNFVKVGLKEFYKKYNVLNFRFYGTGEPTTAFEEMKEITSWIQNHSAPQKHIALQTSGYWQDEMDGSWNSEKAEWIVANIDTIWVSLDAPRDVHDMHRPLYNGQKSSSIIEKNIEFTINHRAKHGFPFIGVRPTVTAENVDRMREMIDYYSELGIDSIWMHHALEPVSNKQENHLDQVASLNLLHFSKQYVDAYFYGKEKGVFVGNFLASNFDGTSDYNCGACSSYHNYTTDGYVSTCDMAYWGDTPFKDFIIGKYNEKDRTIAFDNKKIEKLKTRKLSNMSKCKTCPAGKYCAGGCVGEAYYETGDIFGIRADICASVNYLYKHLPVPIEIPVSHP